MPKQRVYGFISWRFKLVNAITCRPLQSEGISSSLLVTLMVPLLPHERVSPYLYSTKELWHMVLSVRSHDLRQCYRWFEAFSTLRIEQRLRLDSSRMPSLPREQMVLQKLDHHGRLCVAMSRSKPMWWENLYQYQAYDKKIIRKILAKKNTPNKTGLENKMNKHRRVLALTRNSEEKPPRKMANLTVSLDNSCRIRWSGPFVNIRDPCISIFIEICMPKPTENSLTPLPSAL